MHFRRLNFPLFPSNVTQSLAERQSPAGIKRGSRVHLPFPRGSAFHTPSCLSGRKRKARAAGARAGGGRDGYVCRFS